MVLCHCRCRNPVYYSLCAFYVCVLLFPFLLFVLGFVLSKMYLLILSANLLHANVVSVAHCCHVVHQLQHPCHQGRRRKVAPVPQKARLQSGEMPRANDEVTGIEEEDTTDAKPEPPQGRNLELELETPTK